MAAGPEQLFFSSSSSSQRVALRRRAPRSSRVGPPLPPPPLPLPVPPPGSFLFLLSLPFRASCSSRLARSPRGTATTRGSRRYCGPSSGATTSRAKAASRSAAEECGLLFSSSWAQTMASTALSSSVWVLALVLRTRRTRPDCYCFFYRGGRGCEKGKKNKNEIEPPLLPLLSLPLSYQRRVSPSVGEHNVGVPFSQ